MIKISDEEGQPGETDRPFYEVCTFERKETIKDLREFTPDIQLTDTFHSPVKSSTDTERVTNNATSPEPSE